MKKKAVFLNSAKLDFDQKLNYSSLADITEFKKFDDSTDEQILERVQGQDIVITKELPVGRNLISKFPSSVKIICEAGTGFNNIDLEAAREKNIAVCNVPSYSTEAVGHLAITLILNLSASLIQQQKMLDRGNFDNFTKYLQVPHFEVIGKTVGVIGGGAIGRQTIKAALALGMNVVVYDPAPRPLGESAVKFVSLEELLSCSDFISIHCPLMPSTKHLINKETLKLVKPSAYIINTSRGPIINEADLIEALKAGKLAGAALDVQEVEPTPLDNPLFSMDNVIMTPHIGWRRIESRQRLVNLTADNITAFTQGKPTNVVN
ncbi:MAG: NAD(P)-dependent oxidoreductase [Negativicutes bacterium]|nr:NAD(P)-dependent oxidoreductase [Negativicutes bacterium]